jgi:hypothetical protein
MLYCLEIIFITLLASHGTHYLVSKKNIHPVRASSTLTLCFIALTYLFPNGPIELFQAAFFGGSFVGMSDSKKLSLRQLSAASVIFSLIFYFLIHNLKGIGGALGFSAFTSCLIVYSSRKVINFKK